MTLARVLREPVHLRLHHHATRDGQGDGHESGGDIAFALGVGQPFGHHRHDYSAAGVVADYDLLFELHKRSRTEARQLARRHVGCRCRHSGWEIVGGWLGCDA